MYTIYQIGTVTTDRKDAVDDYWGEVTSIIEMDERFDESCLDGIDSFSHLEIIYLFHLVDDNKIQYGARHPRNNPEWPKAGIFAQRGKNRPNKLGATIVQLLKREGRIIHVTGLDAIDGTPVIDIKPVMKEFLPAEEVKQPAWASELMMNYWK
ncbi:SAM-dependent methyltransferase [Bacillus sp. T33-2]|uniref:SAM-dependent methyltransferase n=1 Tax=Bacillus sp. T33-2 TaxID=2054168 RepID=UPI000C760B75|nr:SAM-dependent methyltransferase [Bacillus sp. T33-2]PLR91969.1 tRNA (N6-threonylcarbamoyladenosine(37)-N6)-methyltransferase TrmO [Bacillus sp. T33-2]